MSPTPLPSQLEPKRRGGSLLLDRRSAHCFSPRPIPNPACSKLSGGDGHYVARLSSHTVRTTTTTRCIVLTSAGALHRHE